MVMARTPVTAPLMRPPAYGLIAAAPVLDGGDMAWSMGGFTYQPEGCGIGGRDSISCVGNTGAMEPERAPANIDGDPIWIWGGDECSTLGSGDRDWLGRARRQLAMIESAELANELWEGTITIADGLANRFLAGPGAESDTVTLGPTELVTALACLEAGLADALHGGQGMIHVTNQLLVHLVAADVVMKQGNLWVSPNGHIVVADAGYTGSGPALAGGAVGSVGPTTTSQWAFATGIIQVRLGPVVTFPNTMDDARGLAQAMRQNISGSNAGINDLVAIAGRVAAFQWSTECAHFAAEVNIGTCLLGGAS